MPKRVILSWNAMSSAYGRVDVQNWWSDETRWLFESKEDTELVSWNCLVSGYIRNSCLADARILFNRMVVRDEVSWNSMVSGYIQNGMLDEVRVFDDMPEKNAVSWNSLIVGYMQAQRMDMAKELFDMMPCRNIGSWNTVITGSIEEAYDAFQGIADKDLVSWNAMVTDVPVEPDVATWGTLLGACRVHGNTELGEKAEEVIFEMQPENAGCRPIRLMKNLRVCSDCHKAIKYISRTANRLII
ncbi:hypothetical protein MLD38_040669 [Melastoma candidum]|nr:hypothetical protein MLD38_040669 [Melastoma candidum]